MWYHYVLAAIFAFLVIWGIYAQVTSSFSSIFSRIFGIVYIVVFSYGFYWAYGGIMTPVVPPMFGGRR
jgi:hypothetical protein